MATMVLLFTDVLGLLQCNVHNAFFTIAAGWLKIAAGLKFPALI
jgi:hypothetical protein